MHMDPPNDDSNAAVGTVLMEIQVDRSHPVYICNIGESLHQLKINGSIAQLGERTTEAFNCAIVRSLVQSRL